MNIHLVLFHYFRFTLKKQLEKDLEITVLLTRIHERQLNWHVFTYRILNTEQLPQGRNRKVPENVWLVLMITIENYHSIYLMVLSLTIIHPTSISLNSFDVTLQLTYIISIFPTNYELNFANSLSTLRLFISFYFRLSHSDKNVTTW